MKSNHWKSILASHPWRLMVPVVGTTILAFGCAPGDEATEEAPADEMAMEAEGTMADAPPMPSDAPGCQFTASGEELTSRASPPDSTMAQVGEGIAKICYGAPSVRDRVIFGGLQEFGEPWRIGANEPTTLFLPVTADIGGVVVTPGAYSLYAILGESEWEIVINSNTDRWGIPIDDSVRQSDVGSFTVQPETLDASVERLSVELEPADDGADVVIEWATTRVSFPIRPN